MDKLHTNTKYFTTTKSYTLCCLIALSLWLYLLLFFHPFNNPTRTLNCLVHPPAGDTCAGRYVYVHSLPSTFNSDIISTCHNLSRWIDMCPALSNSGLGPPLIDNDDDNSLSPTGWYNTDQFSLDLIFHSRMSHYECQTSDPSLASAIYVPFYAGLDVGRYLWDGYSITVRDSTAAQLVKWLVSRPEWARMGGHDHFLVAGRITWDFRRLNDEDSCWGSKFLFMPEAKNMTVLTIESSPWHANDVAIPYPTYFHPSSENEIVSWQSKVRQVERPWLFSFAGAPRANMNNSIRGILIQQCQSSFRCNLLDCQSGPNKCHSPTSIMKLFRSSVFCLQPPGDSFTRRSAFDAMVAGCIPVFFHPGTAYVQYIWHLPRDYRNYSVFISEDKVREGKVNIEEVLRRFSDEEVSRMREEVVRLIPRLVYRDPRGTNKPEGGMKDAFDVAIEGVIERVKRMRKGEFSGFEDQKNSWKYNLGWKEAEHEWDHFFFRGKK